MRLKVEIDELTPDQWRQAQESLNVRYDIPDGVSRVCLTLVHGDEERHVETPVGVLVGLLTTLRMVPAFTEMAKVFSQVRAVLTPDDPGLPADRAECSPECEAQDDDRPHHLKCPTRKRDA